MLMSPLGTDPIGMSDSRNNTVDPQTRWSDGKVLYYPTLSIRDFD